MGTDMSDDDDTQAVATTTTTAAGLPWAPQATRYIPFTVVMPDGHAERALVDAEHVWGALMGQLPHWLNPDVKHSFAEAELRTTLKAGVKMARALLIDSFLAQLPPGYPKAPNRVAKGEDYLLVFTRYLFRLFVDLQAASGGPVAVVSAHETGRWAVTDVSLPQSVGSGGHSGGGDGGGDGRTDAAPGGSNAA
jgi:hypothetical protein